MKQSYKIAFVLMVLFFSGSGVFAQGEVARKKIKANLMFNYLPAVLLSDDVNNSNHIDKINAENSEIGLRSELLVDLEIAPIENSKLFRLYFSKPQNIGVLNSLKKVESIKTIESLDIELTAEEWRQLQNLNFHNSDTIYFEVDEDRTRAHRAEALNIMIRELKIDQSISVVKSDVTLTSRQVINMRGEFDPAQRSTGPLYRLQFKAGLLTNANDRKVLKDLLLAEKKRDQISNALLKEAWSTGKDITPERVQEIIANLPDVEIEEDYKTDFSDFFESMPIVRIPEDGIGEPVGEVEPTPIANLPADNLNETLQFNEQTKRLLILDKRANSFILDVIYEEAIPLSASFNSRYVAVHRSDNLVDIFMRGTSEKVKTFSAKNLIEKIEFIKRNGTFTIKEINKKTRVFSAFSLVPRGMHLNCEDLLK